MAMRTVQLDVRPFHERGEEPFQAIMDAVGSLGPDDAFLLVNSFEPIPLFGVMKRMGFTYSADEVAPDEWRILFTRTP